MTIVVETAAYRLEVADDGLAAVLSSPCGAHWATLRPLAALDTVEGVDETLAVSSPHLVSEEPPTIAVERRSTRWDRAVTTLVCAEDCVEIHTEVDGRGSLGDVHLLGCRSLVPGRPLGFLPSGSSFRRLFSPNPGDPAKLVRSAAEAAVVGVSGDGNLGRGHWFFTPAPLHLSLAAAEEDGWVGLGLAAPVRELTFVQLAYTPGDRSFALELDYDGHTRVEGRFAAPAVLLTPGQRDPYAALRRHREDLAARGLAPAPAPRTRPAWWSEPMFCGWGAQVALPGRAADHATQERYDEFLATLEHEGVVPGTVVVDDKWQATYGGNEPDTAKWPDLRGWIAARHERGQRVLLWLKAWDAEGLPPELCIRTADGVPVALDPSHPGTRRLLAEAVERMLSPDGLDADGFKIDFTARTPSGRALALHGPGWGIALLHELLATVYEAAKRAKPDALVVTQTPNPGFADVADMIRLNDTLRLDDPGPLPPVVPQMRYRAAVVHAAMPDLLVDTDDWYLPTVAEWREYAEVKPSLGVPSLYYARALNGGGEELGPEEYEVLRRTWAAWRDREGAA